MKTMRAFLLGTAAMLACTPTAPALAGDTIPAPLKVKSVQFTPTPAPANVLEMTQPCTPRKRW